MSPRFRTPERKGARNTTKFRSVGSSSGLSPGLGTRLAVGQGALPVCRESVRRTAREVMYLPQPHRQGGVVKNQQQVISQIFVAGIEDAGGPGWKVRGHCWFRKARRSERWIWTKGSST